MISEGLFAEWKWSRLKIDLTTLRVDVTDHSFATLIDGSQPIEYASANDCTACEANNMDDLGGGLTGN